MTIQTIQEALASMGLKLSEGALVQRAKQAVEAGDELDISIKVKRDKQGAVVSMSSTLISQRESHGRLIRLE